MRATWSYCGRCLYWNQYIAFVFRVEIMILVFLIFGVRVLASWDWDLKFEFRIWNLKLVFDFWARELRFIFEFWDLRSRFLAFWDWDLKFELLIWRLKLVFDTSFWNLRFEILVHTFPRTHFTQLMTVWLPGRCPLLRRLCVDYWEDVGVNLQFEGSGCMAFGLNLRFGF